MKAKKPRVVCARFFEYIGPDLNAGQNNQTLIALIQFYKKLFLVRIRIRIVTYQDHCCSLVVHYPEELLHYVYIILVLTSNHVVQVLVPQLLPGPALPGALPAPLQLDPHVALPAAPLTSSPAPPPARLGLGGVLGVGQLLPQLPHHHLVAGPVLSTHHALTLLQLKLQLQQIKHKPHESYATPV